MAALDIIHNSLYEFIFNGIATTSSLASDIIPIQGITCYAIQASWATLTATAPQITTYGSNDGVVFTQIDAVVPTGAAGSYLLNVEKAGYRFVKIIYTQTGVSPAGFLTITISGKII